MQQVDRAVMSLIQDHVFLQLGAMGHTITKQTVAMLTVVGNALGMRHNVVLNTLDLLELAGLRVLAPAGLAGDVRVLRRLVALQAAQGLGRGRSPRVLDLDTVFAQLFEQLLALVGGVLDLLLLGEVVSGVVTRVGGDFTEIELFKVVFRFLGEEAVSRAFVGLQGTDTGDDRTFSGSYGNE
eukprot:TRINITY_DN288_c0_g1_i7.p1 TRINITY_DN288_c0_g1~~TRINITY_DN288_c0_g1_i7.p1  ORF type:complete len:182 (+),score=22.49 TRINITY_DN288_c0_g1_i7:542-1087(+)